MTGPRVMLTSDMDLTRYALTLSGRRIPLPTGVPVSIDEPLAGIFDGPPSVSAPIYAHERMLGASVTVPRTALWLLAGVHRYVRTCVLASVVERIAQLSSLGVSHASPGSKGA